MQHMFNVITCIHYLAFGKTRKPRLQMCSAATNDTQSDYNALHTLSEHMKSPLVFDVVRVVQ